MNSIETIKKRKSCRTFNHIALKLADKKDLESYISENRKFIGDEIINLSIIEKNSENKEMKLDYGMIKGHNTYILGASKSSVDSRVNFGYIMEKVVLKATEIGISTCWVGYFDNTYFNEIVIENGFEIPSIVIVGYSKDRRTNLDKLLRFTLNSSRRHDWNKLFYNYKSKAPLMPYSLQKYSDSIEMVRLAPSSGNTQPWRIFFDDTINEFHFFKKPINKSYEEKGLHDIDLGIALSHFELTSLNNGLSGDWIKHTKENINSIDNLQYIISWKCR